MAGLENLQTSTDLGHLLVSELVRETQRRLSDYVTQAVSFLHNLAASLSSEKSAEVPSKAVVMAEQATLRQCNRDFDSFTNFFKASHSEGAGLLPCQVVAIKEFIRLLESSELASNMLKKTQTICEVRLAYVKIMKRLQNVCPSTVMGREIQNSLLSETEKRLGNNVNKTIFLAADMEKAIISIQDLYHHIVDQPLPLQHTARDQNQDRAYEIASFVRKKQVLPPLNTSPTPSLTTQSSIRSELDNYILENCSKIRSWVGDVRPGAGAGSESSDSESELGRSRMTRSRSKLLEIVKP
ncbi:hypothetical protein Ciccas_005118 [Cichlidogyrus casuarinus]|uniref:Uncharacterized protein n=1 Tax=Cichlidogyrus casuarinus TaxID=1844966 RepID=A0ABD2Q9K5_9PLAT